MRSYEITRPKLSIKTPRPQTTYESLELFNRNPQTPRTGWRIDSNPTWPLGPVPPKRYRSHRSRWCGKEVQMSRPLRPNREMDLSLKYERQIDSEEQRARKAIRQLNHAARRGKLKGKEQK